MLRVVTILYLFLQAGINLPSVSFLNDNLTIHSEKKIAECNSNQITQVLYSFGFNRVNQEDHILINEIAEHQRSKIKQITITLLGAFLFLSLIFSLFLIHRYRKKNCEIKRVNAQLNTLNNRLEAIVENRTQDLLDTLKRAQESDKMKSAFLANMSHEIRTPLNGILGFAKLLNDDNLPSNLRNQYVEIINRRGRSLLQIINDIINLSLIDSGQIQINPIPFNLNQLLYDLYSMFSSSEYDKKMTNIGFNLKVALSDSRSYIISDPHRLEQIVTNLLDNAFKNTKVGKVAFGYELIAGQTLAFFVKDTGCGIPDKQRNSIFSRFSKNVNNPYNPQNTGLGLAISKGLVELLNGKIWYETQPDIGTSFYFTIPFQPAASEGKGYISKFSVSSHSLNFKGKTILVVEDDLISYQFIEALLKDTEAKLIHAKNGEDAVEIAMLSPKLDLIIMDMKLPFLDGYEASAQIRKHNPNAIIIAQTANVMSNDREKCLNAGCNEYLPKPIDPDDFLRVVVRYLNKPVLS